MDVAPSGAHRNGPAAADAAITPCVNLCCLDPVTGLCEGCGRTLDEIARWGSLDAAGRRAIMDQLPGRRAGIRRDGTSA